MIWLLILVILFISLILVFAKKIRPMWKKLLLVFLLLIVIIFVTFKFLFPFNDSLETTGPYDVVNERTFYIHNTKYKDMGTDGEKREIPVLLWLPDDNEKEHPLVIFSHGSFGVGESNISLFNELASHGYIVASLEHPYHSFVTKLSNGEKIHVDINFFKEVMSSQGTENLKQTREDFNRWKNIRVEDISFVMDSLIADPKYSKLIDGNQIFLSGHSLGGAAALEVGRNRSDEVLGVIALESPFFGDIIGIEGDRYVFTDEEYPIPVLHFYSDALWGKLDQITTYEMNQRLIDANSDKYVNVHIKGSGHIGLSELSLASPILTNLLDGGMNATPVYEKISIINERTLEFLNSLTK